MRAIQLTNKAFLLALVIMAFLGQPCYADNLLGLWQTQTNYLSAPGQTNKVEAVETIEFFRDHSFTITEVVVLNGKRWTNVPYTGTYTVLRTNRASLKFVPHNLPPGAKPSSRAVSCSVAGDDLEIPKLITSVVPEYKRYRRVK